MTISWRTKLTFVAGVTLIVTGSMLAFAGTGASGATASLPVGGSPTQHPTGPSSEPQSSTPSPTVTGSLAPVTASPTPAAGQNSTGTTGDNGTVKIHNLSTAVTDRRNEPHVACSFYLDAFGFDTNQPVTWKITAWAPTGDRATVVETGEIKLDSNGNGHTDPITLPIGGHFKLFWNFTPENGFAKQKVFWVTPCVSSSTESPPPSSPEESSSAPPSSGGAVAPPPPHGGLPITGWPLAVLVVGAAALMGTGTAAIVVARRRRSLQSSR